MKMYEGTPQPMVDMDIEIHTETIDGEEYCFLQNFIYDHDGIRFRDIDNEVSFPSKYIYKLAKGLEEYDKNNFKQKGELQ